MSVNLAISRVVYDVVEFDVCYPRGIALSRRQTQATGFSLYIWVTSLDGNQQNCFFVLK